MTEINVGNLEASDYRESYSDGVVDLFAGISLAWIGVCWLWIEWLAPFAALLPAALSPTLLPLRRRVVESRLGYVRWGAPRRQWERRQLLGLLILGAGALAAVLALDLALGAGIELETGSLAAAIPAGLIAVPVVVLAAATGIRRLWIYALVLVIGAAITALMNQNPGLPILAAGVAMTLIGGALLAKLLRREAPGAAR